MRLSKTDMLFYFCLSNKLDTQTATFNVVEVPRFRRQRSNLKANLDSSNKTIEQHAANNLKLMMKHQLRGDGLLQILSDDDFIQIANGETISKACFNFKFNQYAEYAYLHLMTDEAVSKLAVDSYNSDNLKR